MTYCIISYYITYSRLYHIILYHITSASLARRSKSRFRAAWLAGRRTPPFHARYNDALNEFYDLARKGWVIFLKRIALGIDRSLQLLISSHG